MCLSQSSLICKLICKFRQQDKYGFSLLTLSIFQLLDPVPGLVVPLLEPGWWAAGATAGA